MGRVVRTGSWVPSGRRRLDAYSIDCGLVTADWPTGEKLMAEHTLRGKVAVVGIGETIYYKHSQSPDPEFILALKAILAACEDAGINPQNIDSFASYAGDR